MENQGGPMITMLLAEASEGKAEAVGKLLPLVYDELKQMASRRMASERADHTLQPTALVHEAYMRMVGNAEVPASGRAQFFFAAAQAMRRVLVDHARTQKRQKRDGGYSVPLDESLVWIGASSVEMLDLDRVFEELNALDARKCRIVELRFFLGFSAEETADLLNISKATVDRELKFVRGWMHERLNYSGA